VTSELIDAANLRPGDRIEGSPCTHPGVMVTILRDGEQTTETVWPLTGRPVLRYWGRREDTGAEGFMSYGTGARVLRVVA
jgi:hypothetical protein